jgi:hypothetical protein
MIKIKNEMRVLMKAIISLIPYSAVLNTASIFTSPGAIIYQWVLNSPKYLNAVLIRASIDNKNAGWIEPSEKSIFVQTQVSRVLSQLLNAHASILTTSLSN